MIKLAEIN